MKTLHSLQGIPDFAEHIPEGDPLLVIPIPEKAAQVFALIGTIPLKHENKALEGTLTRNDGHYIEIEVETPDTETPK